MDIKLFAKNEELATIILTVRIYSQDMGIEFGIEKFAMPIMRNGKRQMTEGIELPNQENHQNARIKRKLQLLENVRSGHRQTSGDERKKIKNEYLWRTKKTMLYKSHQMDCPSCKIHGTIPDVDEGKTSTN